MQIRTLFVAAAVFAASILAADRFALSLAQYSDTEVVTGNTLQTSSLATPTGLNGTVVCAAAGLIRSNDLTWDAAPNATGYLVERAVGEGAFTTLANPVGAAYSDGAVAAGTYKYRVSSTRNNWSSIPSASITLTQPAFCI